MKSRMRSSILSIHHPRKSPPHWIRGGSLPIGLYDNSWLEWQGSHMEEWGHSLPVLEKVSSSWYLRWLGASYMRSSEPASFKESSTTAKHPLHTSSPSHSDKQQWCQTCRQTDRQTEGVPLRVKWQRAQKAALTYRAKVKENPALKMAEGLWTWCHCRDEEHGV